MFRSNLSLGNGLVLLFAFCLLLLQTGCVRVCCSRATVQPAGTPANEVIQEFPTRGQAETAWRVRFAHGSAKGLYITGAWFKRTPGEPWMRILWDARVADIFVPYHSGSPRYYDLTSFSFGLVPATAEDAGCCGTILDSVVVKEVRDRGIAWKDDTEVHRGEALVLWATIDAANYNYIIQYSFRDDGMISFRIGATARNLPGRELEAHMHNGLWRIDIDLNGFSHDSALLAEHHETTADLTANDTAIPINGGQEGAANWRARRFTHIRVVDTVRTNAHGRNISYDLIPLRRGKARHKESFSHQDFWVTRYHGTELIYSQVPTYVSNAESVTDTDVVIWHSSPVHHLPRDEDGEFVGNSWHGVALLMWGGFDLRPRNLFDNTPLHP